VLDFFFARLGKKITAETSKIRELDMTKNAMPKKNLKTQKIMYSTVGEMKIMNRDELLTLVALA